MVKEKIETYPKAARVIHLWLKEFCDESRPYPDRIAEASRRAAKEIDRLREKLKPIEKELCMCPLHFGDCEYCVNGRCTSPDV